MLFRVWVNLRLSTQYIHLKEGVTPFRVTTALMKEVTEEIVRMLQLHIIEPVDKPTEWCSPIMVGPKANGIARIYVDLTNINQAVIREVYHMPTVEETLRSLKKVPVFSKLDAHSVFHQRVLNPESAMLSTFISLFGRYVFKRLQFGISSALEHSRGVWMKNCAG